MEITELNKKRKQCEETIKQKQKELDEIAKVIWQMSTFYPQRNPEEEEAIEWARRKLLIEWREA